MTRLGSTDRTINYSVGLFGIARREPGPGRGILGKGPDRQRDPAELGVWPTAVVTVSPPACHEQTGSTGFILLTINRGSTAPVLILEVLWIS
jgi:hypothetical protein